MKKLFCVLAIACLLVISCGDNSSSNNNYSISITNNSTKTVTYTYNGITDTLPVSETKNYQVKAYTQPPENIVDNNGIESVNIKIDHMTGNYTIVDSQFSYLSVINTLPIDITIKADNYIWDEINNSSELYLSANKERNNKLFIQ